MCPLGEGLNEHRGVSCPCRGLFFFHPYCLVAVGDIISVL
jgi:hypothetical protein